MNKKGLISALLVILMLAALFPAEASAADPPENGWYEEGGNTYYYVGGEQVYGKYCMDDGKCFYFRPEMVKSEKFWTYNDDDEYVCYYAGADGTLKCSGLFSGEKDEDSQYTFYSNENCELIHDSILQISDSWYCFDSDCVMLKNGTFWTYNDDCDEVCYRAKADGKLYCSEWYQDENGDSYYYGSNCEQIFGEKVSIDGYWYYFDENSGVMLKNDVFEGGIYCAKADGKLYQNEWYHAGNGDWYYYDVDCVCARSEFKRINGKWYYFGSGGVMQTGWVKSGGKWYYMNSSGVMQTGWVKSGGKWYYMNSSGAMQTGWVKAGGKWYYMNSSGVMQTGWVKAGGKWYYMDSSGVMLANTSRTIGGKTYKFNSSGVCTNP